eukprot:scaffold113_cov339-Pavlova_lutheri.AAC.23
MDTVRATSISTRRNDTRPHRHEKRACAHPKEGTKRWVDASAQDRKEDRVPKKEEVEEGVASRARNNRNQEETKPPSSTQKAPRSSRCGRTKAEPTWMKRRRSLPPPSPFLPRRGRVTEVWAGSPPRRSLPLLPGPSGLRVPR